MRIASVAIMVFSVGVLALTFNVEPAQSNPPLWAVDDRGSSDFHDIREILTKSDSAGAFSASIGHWPTPTVDSFFQDGLDIPAIGDFHPSFEANRTLDLRNPEEWKNFACVDDDSIELVIRLNDEHPNGYSELTNIILKNRGKLANTISMDDRTAVVVADIPHEALSTFMSEVENSRLSRYIEPNMEVKANFQPNDPGWPRQWGPAKIEADYAWDTQTGDPSVLVAIVDTGIDWDHPDLAANYIPLGHDWANNDSDPMDDMGHGTHCAGILAAVINNGIGIAGMAQVKIMAEKVLDEQGYGYADSTASGIIHATDSGADVISMSIGSYVWGELLQEAVEYASSSGVLLVAAAGNEDTNMKLYPAGYDEVIAVTATDIHDLPPSFTNFGEWVELAAPGVDIYSTISKVHDPQVRYPYDSASGTSMAAPHVAGVAALIWSQFPNMTRDQVRAQLRHTADDLGYPGFDVCYGYGRINARRAVKHVLIDHDLLISHFETPPYVKLGSEAIINFTAFNFGRLDESNITAQLLVNGSLVDSSVIATIASFGSTTVNFLWAPEVEGIHNVTSHVVATSNETFTRNNALSTSIPARSAKIFRVPEDYSTIQAAVDATISGIGDTIRVAAGTYYEHLTICKSVTILGEDRSATIIDGNGTDTVVHMEASMIMRTRIYTTDGMNFSRFTVRHGFHGIYMYGLADVDLSENLVLDCMGSGVDLLSSTGCTMRDNHMNGNRFNFDVDGRLISHYIHDIDPSNMVNGKPIHYWVNKHNRQMMSDAGYVAAIDSTNIIMKDLTIANSGEGVLLVGTTDSTVANVSVKNSMWGLELIESSANTISNNTIQENMCGILLDSSGNNKISGNSVAGNEALAGLAGMFGIGLQGGSSNNIIRRNTLANNTSFFGHGLCLLYFSNNNTICHNDFIDNNVQASVFVSFDNRWDDGYPSGGNYWNDYADVDVFYGLYQNETGNDGIWDAAYVVDGSNQDNYPIVTDYSYWVDPISGDLNLDRKVDMKDLGIAALAFGSSPRHPRWHPIADVNHDEKINLRDIALVAKSFGKTEP